MHWRIQLKDEHGTFWFVAHKQWSEMADDGARFEDPAVAANVVVTAQADAKSNPEWFPRIKMISFRDQPNERTER
jgi:hypothetical protein